MRYATLALWGALLVPAAARADDGSWNNTYDLAEGPLYAVGDNPDVALDNELLVLEDYESGAVTALFQFRNTSDQAVTVQAGFPVQLDLAFAKGYEQNGSLSTQEGRGQPVWLVPSGKYGGDVDPKLLALAGLEVRTGTPVEDEYEIGSRYVRLADFAKRRVEKKVPKKRPFSFALEQDGQPVTLTSMVVELDPAGRPPIVFHFRHTLVLGPKATSVVRVRYKAPTRSGLASGITYMREHTWRYVLRTGATWKGPLGRLVLAVPVEGACDNAAAWRQLGRWGNYLVLERTSFEPTAADDIVCRWQRGDDEPSTWGGYWFDGHTDDKPRPWAEARVMATDVRGIKASSQVEHKEDVYTEVGVVLGAPNAAEAAFDGILETAWSEAAKVDVGEYLELELTRPATGLRLMSGFLGALHPFEHDTAGKRGKLMANLWAYNARPTQLELVAVDGSRRWTLPVVDRKAVWNVYPILVPAGRYRLVIKATAKGKKWQDTSIAEVDFATGDAAWLEALRQDAFYAPFFMDGAPYLQPWASEMAP